METLVGTRRELAQRLAEDFRFPLAPHARDDLPQVAQYLAVIQSLRFLPRMLVQYLCDELRRRHPAALDEEVCTLTLEQVPRKKLLRLLDDLLERIWMQQHHHHADDPYRVMAGLPVPIYITTDTSNLLHKALHQAGKQPQIVVSPWNEAAKSIRTVYADNPDYEPDPDTPLVYHVFGTFDHPDTLVLTEDHYFDYLIGITRNKDLIPQSVRAALVNSALMFLGFRMDDWAFRVFFRTLMGQDSAERRRHYAHVAVQVTPEENRFLDQQRAQRYLEEYFSKGADISVYWGHVDDFMRELNHRWQEQS
jgi:hypothetical protein